VLGLNDAQAAGFAAREHVPAELAESKPVLYLNQGTGIGGEFYTRDSRTGRVVSGRQLGLLCEYGEIVQAQPDGLATFGDMTSGEGIAKGYGPCVDLDHDEAADVWHEIGRKLAYGCAALMPVIGPGAIIIGGGVSRCFPRYQEGLRDGFDAIFGTLSSDSSTERPQVFRVPPDRLATLPLEGLYFALRATDLSERTVIVRSAA
jgi:hypothetical protein